MQEARIFFDQLLQCDSTAELETILEENRWSREKNNWRLLGDTDNNAAVVDAQQANPVNALAEKITNSLDAVLIAKCAESGVPIRGDHAPKSFKAAIDKLYFPDWIKGGSSTSESAAKPWELPNLKEDVVTLTATGAIRSGRKESTAKRACISIADTGEGQEPSRVPETFMTIIGNEHEGSRTAYKKDIPFAQGTFNMGGSGVFQFCKYQLLITRKHPSLRGGNEDSDKWGFTIVRVVDDDKFKTGAVVEYLAPIESEGGRGNILSFDSATMGLMPGVNPKGKLMPYERQISHGTLVKLYEYDTPGTTTNIIIDDADLKRQLEVTLPVLGLPVQAADTRYQDGKRQSTPMKGLLRVIDDQCQKSVESAESGNERYEGPPVSGQLTIDGVQIPWITYVRTRAENDTDSNSGFRSLTRKGREQVILHKNGQNQGTWDKSLHGDADLAFLARENTIITFVDVSSLKSSTIRKLFRASRDGLKTGDVATTLRKRLVDALANDPTLREYQNLQRARRATQLNSNPKELKAATERILRNSDYLKKLLGAGASITMSSLDAGIAGKGDEKASAKLEFTPSYFRYKNGDTHRERVAEFGRDVRLQLEIDCFPDYFVRADSPGAVMGEVIETGESLDLNVGNPRDGALNVSIYLPDSVEVGEVVNVRLWIEDELLIQNLEVSAELTMVEPRETKPGNGGNRKGPNEKGESLQGSKLLSSRGLPLIILRYDPNHPEGRDGENYFKWDEDWNATSTAKLRLDTEPMEFHVNIDNEWVNRFKRESKDSYEIAERNYQLGLYILALGAMIRTESSAEVKDLTPSQRDEKIIEKVHDVSDLSTPTLLEVMKQGMVSMRGSDQS